MGGVWSALTGGDNQRIATFEENPFAEGRFRFAIRGTWVSPPSMRGQRCVIKYMKESYTWRAADWNTTIQLYEQASMLAREFNRFERKNDLVSFVTVQVLKCNIQNFHRNNSAGLQHGEFCVAEPYLPGTYRKWCNNKGYWDNTQPGVEVMQAFMHWSFCQTGGQKIIADLQGIEANSQYILTDPAILSRTGQYGSSDLGVEGMLMMLLNHTCNRFCGQLPKPDIQNIWLSISQEQRQACMQAFRAMNNSTAYTWELVLPELTRHQLAAMFDYI